MLACSQMPTPVELTTNEIQVQWWYSFAAALVAKAGGFSKASFFERDDDSIHYRRDGRRNTRAILRHLLERKILLSF